MVLGLSEQKRGFEKVEQSGHFAPGRRQCQPGMQYRCSARGGKLPSGFIRDHHLRALQQRTYPARHPPILRDDGNALPAFAEPADDGLRRPQRFIFHAAGFIPSDTGRGVDRLGQRFGLYPLVQQFWPGGAEYGGPGRL